MRLNIEDFLRGATAVAQGTLAGKLQARQAAQAQRQQEVQTSLALHQAGQQQEEGAYQQEEANDNHLIQNVMPKLTPKSQQEMLRQIEQRRMSRQQRRQQSQAQRAGMLPPWMQPYFAPPANAPGAVPVNPTQPQTNMGPGSTPLQAGTAGVMPGSQNSVQLPTDPATPPPGAFAPPIARDAGTRLQAPLAPSQAMGMPTPEQMGQPPLSPAPAPPVAPPAPGVVTPAPPPAPGGTTAPVNSRRVTFDGFQGDFEFKGVTPEQVKQFQADRDKAQKFVGSYVGDPTVRAELDSYYEQLPLSVETEEDLEKAQRILRMIESRRTSGARDAFAFDEARYNRAGTDYTTATQRLRDVRTSPKLGAALLRTALGKEDEMAGMGRFDKSSMGLLAGFPEERQAYEDAVKAGDPKRANSILESVAHSLRNNERDSSSAAANNRAVLGIINNMNSRDRNNPKAVAKQLRIFGYDDIASRIEKDGEVSFGGYRAEKTFYDLLKQADNWSEMDDTSRDMFLSQLRTAGEQAGMPAEELKKIVGARLTKLPKPLTAYQNALLTDRDLDRDLKYKQYRLAEKRYDVYKRHTEKLDAGGAGGAGSVSAKLRGPQHRVDQLWNAYQKVMTDKLLTDADLSDKGNPDAVQAKKLYDQYTHAYAAWAKVYERETGVNPNTGEKAAPTKKAELAAPAIGAKMSPQEHQAWQQRLATMSPEDKLRLLGTRTRKQ